MVRNSLGWGARLLGGVLGLACLVVRPERAFAAEPPKAGAPEAPVVFLKPTQRDGHASSNHRCSGLTGGGAVTVVQPAPDTLTITLTGAAAAKANPCAPSMASLEAAVEQGFVVVFPAGYKPAHLILEGRVIGLLRSEGLKCGNAELVQATAAVLHDSQTLVGLNFPTRSVNGHEALAINLADGPACVPVGPGCHRLHMSLHVIASQGRCLCPHISSAEFAPPPALPATWIHFPDPFNGVDRSGLGFQVTVRVEPTPKTPAAE